MATHTDGIPFDGTHMYKPTRNAVWEFEMKLFETIEYSILLNFHWIWILWELIVVYYLPHIHTVHTRIDRKELEKVQMAKLNSKTRRWTSDTFYSAMDAPIVYFHSERA